VDSTGTDGIVGPIALVINKTVFEGNLGGALHLLALVNVIQLIIPVHIISWLMNIGGESEIAWLE